MTANTTKIKVNWLATSDLIPHPTNPKEHPPEQVAQIVASIQAFGFNDPIAVDDNNVVIEGHGRLLAAQKLGLEKVPVLCLAHLSEAERRAYALAHNKLTLNSGWDSENLVLEIEALQDLAFENLELTGFTLEELNGFQSGEHDAVLPHTDMNDEKTEVSIQYQNQYGVIVTCNTEAEQERVFSELSEAGYVCKVVTV